MPKFIINPKTKKGIIAEIVGKNMLRIKKRKSDNNPIHIVIQGADYSVVANDTLTGDAIFIECENGAIKTEDLLIEERNDNGEKVEQTGATGSGASGASSSGPEQTGASGATNTGSSGPDETSGPNGETGAEA